MVVIIIIVIMKINFIFLVQFFYDVYSRSFVCLFVCLKNGAKIYVCSATSRNQVARKNSVSHENRVLKYKISNFYQLACSHR